jgi:hypothetical protein
MSTGGTTDEAILCVTEQNQRLAAQFVGRDPLLLAQRMAGSRKSATSSQEPSFRPRRKTSP